MSKQGGAPQGQGSQSDNSMAPVWIIILLFVTGAIIWFVWKAYIVAFVFKIKLLEAHVISLFTDKLNNVIDYMQTVAPASVNFEQMFNVSTAVGDYIRYPVIVILAVLAFLLYSSNIKLKFRKTYDMDKLRKQERENWPMITPVVNLDLVSTPLREGPWAMGVNPLEFAQKFNLLKKDITAKSDAPGQASLPSAVVKKGEARRIFTLQLGHYWEGVEQSPIHVRALMAAFAAKHNRDRDGCSQLLHQINESTMTGKLNFEGTDELLSKHINNEDIQAIIQRHGYVLTMMASMLEASRMDGVMPSAEFLWLKVVDRRLWYMLNTIGRQTPFTEVAGPYAHWLAERELGQKIMVPMVDEAVTGLENAIKEIKLTAKQLAEIE